MSDTNTTAEPAKTPSKASLVPKPDELQPLTVEREVDGTKVSLNFTPSQILKGTSAGSWNLAPDFSDKAKVLAFVGVDKVFDFVKSKFKALSNGWTFEASESEDEATGNPIGFSADKFIEFASKFAARGESISELQDQREELLEQMSLLDADNDADAPAIIALMRQIKTVNADIASKKRKPKAEKVAESVKMAA